MPSPLEIIPANWIIVYCTICGRSTTWTKEDAESYDEDWYDLYGYINTEMLEHKDKEHA